MTELPVLKSPRCVLSCITEEDIPVLRQIFDDGLTRKYLSELWTLVETDEGIRQMLSSFNILMKKNEGLIWGARLNGKLIAFVAVMDLSCNPTIIYAMHPVYRFKGYMKECVAIVMDYLQDTGLCRTIQTEVYPDNCISQKILKDVGFIPLMLGGQKYHFMYSFKNSSNSNH